jgi:hypothetical protein
MDEILSLITGITAIEKELVKSMREYFNTPTNVHASVVVEMITSIVTSLQTAIETFTTQILTQWTKCQRDEQYGVRFETSKDMFQWIQEMYVNCHMFIIESLLQLLHIVAIVKINERQTVEDTGIKYCNSSDTNDVERFAEAIRKDGK